MLIVIAITTVRIKVRQKISSLVAVKGERRKWDVGRLKTGRVSEEYQRKITSDLTKGYDNESTDIEKKWNSIKY